MKTEIQKAITNTTALKWLAQKMKHKTGPQKEMAKTEKEGETCRMCKKEKETPGHLLTCKNNIWLQAEAYKTLTNMAQRMELKIEQNIKETEIKERQEKMFTEPETLMDTSMMYTKEQAKTKMELQMSELEEMEDDIEQNQEKQEQEEIKLLEQIENTPEHIKTWRKLIFVWQKGNQEADKKAKQVAGRQMIRKEWQMIRDGGKVNRIKMRQYATKKNMERKKSGKNIPQFKTLKKEYQRMADKLLGKYAEGHMKTEIQKAITNTTALKWLAQKMKHKTGPQKDMAKTEKEGETCRMCKKEKETPGHLLTCKNNIWLQAEAYKALTNMAKRMELKIEQNIKETEIRERQERMFTEPETLMDTSMMYTKEQAKTKMELQMSELEERN